MRALPTLPLLFCATLFADQATDRAAIQKTIARFNDPHARASIVTRNADLARLNRPYEQEVSPMYFEAKATMFVTPDVVIVDAVASQYGSLILKRSIPALFLLCRDGGEWRIAFLRLAWPMP